MGESFSDAICPPVSEDDASAHECYNAMWSVLGKGVTPSVLAALSTSQISRLAIGIGRYFETEPPTVEQVRAAIARTLARWPVGSLGEQSEEKT
jgi:hypothetical protein